MFNMTYIYIELFNLGDLKDIVGLFFILIKDIVLEYGSEYLLEPADYMVNMMNQEPSNTGWHIGSSGSGSSSGANNGAINDTGTGTGTGNDTTVGTSVEPGDELIPQGPDTRLPVFEPPMPDKDINIYREPASENGYIKGSDPKWYKK